MAEQKGKVYLVGAGPGETTHLTIQGQQLLAQAEVVIYDALINPQLLELTPTNCLHINVGKRGNCPSANQDDINHLLVEQCQKGKQVVRLKNGDPFIFGRCAAEIAALRAAECGFEVVPGLSSALAVPLLAGIPLTDLTLSRCFTVLSAHDPTILDWQALARMDTLVILMGGKHLPEIVHQLQMQGKSSSTPVAVIRWGGRSDQRVWRGTLADILDQTAEESLSPAVIIVGEVARLQLDNSAHPQDESLPLLPLNEPGYNAASKHSVPIVARSEALQSGPLMGKTILVTRSAGQSNQFNDFLKQQGAQVIGMPALEIGPPSSWDALDKVIADLAKFDWLILTSTNGVDYFFERLWSQGKDIRALAGIQIAVVGQKTAVSLNQRGLKPDFVPPEFVAESLVTHFPGDDDLTGTQILFPRVETGGRDTLVAELTNKGAEVVEVAAYQSRCPEMINPLALDMLRGRAVDVITFASSKTVKNFCQLLEQAAQELVVDPGQESTDSEWKTWLEDVHLASIGPQTSKTCRNLLGRVDLEATTHTLEGLTQAIIDCHQ